MNKKKVGFIALCTTCTMASLFLTAADLQELNGKSKFLPFAPDGVPFTVAKTKFKIDKRGNHRAVVRVSKAEKNAVKAVLPWRRPDLRPETKRVVVIDAQTDKEITNVKVTDFSSESGTVIFEPKSGNGVYYIYYLPYIFRRDHGDARYGSPWNDYLPPFDQADKAWVAGLTKNPPQTELIRFESRYELDAFTPMGIIATANETKALLDKYPNRPAVLFPEDRAFPIKLLHKIPARWAKTGALSSFSGTACKNEYYTWQIGVWAARAEIKHVKLSFSDFKNGNSTIPQKEITCFNQEGIGWDGKPLTFDINVPQNDVQALWCGIQIPKDANEGIYRGTVTFQAEGIPQQTIPVEIKVKNQVLADKGDGEIWRHSRLRWLNSTIGDTQTPTYPFKNITVDGRSVTATDKMLQIGPNGLPTSISVRGKEILENPMRFLIVTDKGEISCKATDAKIHRDSDGRASWQFSYSAQDIHFTGDASMEFDGNVHYNIKVSTDKPIDVKDVRLELDYTPYASKYMIGAGCGGGNCPKTLAWRWNGPWDSYWMGNTGAGLHVEYWGADYHGPLLRDYRTSLPQVWANRHKGMISVSLKEGSGAKVVTSTGDKKIIPSSPENYEFDMMITPAKSINTKKHFSNRLYSDYREGYMTKFDEAAKEGANVISSITLNSWNEYSLVNQDKMLKFLKHEHECNRKVIVYYACRELSNRLANVFAIRSLKHEIFVQGIGYGLPWQCEQFVDDYRPAWYTSWSNEDSGQCFVINGFSRFVNYYMENLRWMCENWKIDGIYIDDCAYDRPTLKRVRRVLDKYRPGATINLHSNTAYSVGPANQYTGFFPYLDRLWFGESFNYNAMPDDQWIVQCSGIPFGLMNDMLMDGGNRFLGMLYGSTARHSWPQYVRNPKASPAPVWGVWKLFGIEDSKMLGYWDENCPVKTSDQDVKATVYTKPGKFLISLGNFSNKEKKISLTFDWNKLGISAEKAVLEAPEVKYFQQATTFTPNDTIPVLGKRGWLLIVSEKK